MIDYVKGFGTLLIFVQSILVISVARGTKSIVDSVIRVLSILLTLALFHYLLFNYIHDQPSGYRTIATAVALVLLLSITALNDRFHKDW